MNAQIRLIQDNFCPLRTVVNLNRTRSSEANQKLMRYSMRMLAANLFTRHIEHNKISFWSKRKTFVEFCY